MAPPARARESAPSPPSSGDPARISDVPGWPEIGAGLFGLALIAVGGAALIERSGLDAVAAGLAFTALSGIAGLAGFAAAVAIRRRGLAAFGFRRLSWRWFGIAVAAGLVAFLAKGIAIPLFVALTGVATDTQASYGIAGSGGVGSLLLATALLSILTPVGEEFLFRGVIASALLRYGAWIGVLGSTAIFAAVHGYNAVLPAAVVGGLFTGEIFRRSRSIWAPVTVHVVFNLPTVPVLVLAGAST